MMRELQNERGAISAEFAIVLPVLLLTVGIVLGAIMLSSTRVTLVSAAHDISRLEARGDIALASSRVATLPPGTRVDSSVAAGILCTTLGASPGRGILSRIVITGTGCAAVSAGLP